MSNISYIAGTIFIVMATIARAMAQKNINLPGNWLLNLVMLPSKNFPDDVYASIGQLMGVLWVLIGLFLDKTENWFSSSWLGIILEPLVVFAPFIMSKIFLNLLFTSKEK